MFLTTLVTGVVVLMGAYAVGNLLDLSILPRNDVRMVIPEKCYRKALKTGCIPFQNLGNLVPRFIKLTYWKNASEYAQKWYSGQECVIIKLDMDLVKLYGYELMIENGEPVLFKDPMSMLLSDVILEVEKIE